MGSAAGERGHVDRAALPSVLGIHRLHVQHASTRHAREHARTHGGSPLLWWTLVGPPRHVEELSHLE